MNREELKKVFGKNFRKELKKEFKQDLKSNIYFYVNNLTKNDSFYTQYHVEDKNTGETKFDFGALKKDVLMYIDNSIIKVNNGFSEIFGITFKLTDSDLDELFGYYLNQYFYRLLKR